MATEANVMLSAALEYAGQGFSVFPLTACDKTPFGKLAPNGFKDATTDRETITRWWQAEPNANIGIACGVMSGGLVIIDVDMHKADGKTSLDNWLKENGLEPPRTATVITGGNGLHHWYTSKEPTGCRTNVIPGVDVKGDGGYIVAPPSVHPTGTPYIWASGLGLADTTIAEVNDVVQKLLKTGNKKASNRKGKIPEGERNDALARHLGSLRHEGWEQDALEAEAIRFNHKRLSPPLPNGEALKVAESIGRYPAGYVAAGMAGSPVDGSLLEKLAGLRPEDISRYKNTEQGWGYLFAEVFKDKARYCPERKSWFVFDGVRWKHDPAALLAGECAKHLADALHLYILQVPESLRPNLSNGWQKWQKRNTRDTILRDAAGVYPVALTDFDTNPYLLNVSNGTLNLETEELQPHSADDLLTRLAPVSFNPEATFPRWERFVDEVMDGGRDTARCLQKCLGYTLTGSTELEKMFILYGATSRNGKSTLAETVLGLMGEYAASADPEMLSTSRTTGGGMRATEDLARLDGKRFVSVSEPSKGMTLNSARLKQWTGSDSVTARFLHENSFEFTPHFKMFLNTNDLPQASDTALFKSGRVVVIPFNHHFTPEEQDTTLKQQFLTDAARSAVLNWMLEGWQLLQSEGLNLPSSVTSAVDEYRAESDLIRRFVDEQLEPDVYGEIPTTALLPRYQEWARANGVEQFSSNTFKGELARAGLKVDRRRPKTGGNATPLLLGYSFSERTGGIFTR